MNITCLLSKHAKILTRLIDTALISIKKADKGNVNQFYLQNTPNNH